MCCLGQSQDVKHSSVSLVALCTPGCLCGNSTVGGLCHCQWLWYHLWPVTYWWLWYHWLHPILSPALASMRQAVPTGAARTCQQVLPVGSCLQWGDFPVLMRLGRLGPSTCQLSLRY